MPAPSADWLHDRPQIRTIRAAACDVNGVARGKRMPIPSAVKMLTGGTRFPFSALNVDIWGEDIADSPLVFDSGDRDAILFPTERGFVPMPWLEAPTALLPIWMFHEDGRPYEGDPRHALSFVQKRFAEKGLTPVVAVELEFYLIDDSTRRLQVPISPRSGKRRDAAEVLSIRALDAFDIFFTDLYEACEVMDIPADTLISEAGIGQFEVNLMHQDAMRTADDAWLFKTLVRGLARRFGFAATFMAKPMQGEAGNAMHIHQSVVDAKTGKNIFSAPDGSETELFRSFIGGMQHYIPKALVMMAPYVNSYRRLTPEMAAPVNTAWGYDNRTTAFRIPTSNAAGRRVENRLPSSDANPYLALAASLACGYLGMVNGLVPTSPTAETANEGAISLPRGLLEAVSLMEAERDFDDILGREFTATLAGVKRGEFETFMRVISPWEREFLLLNV